MTQAIILTEEQATEVASIIKEQLMKGGVFSMVSKFTLPDDTCIRINATRLSKD